MSGAFSLARLRGAPALAIAVLGLVIIFDHHAPLVVFNASASAPIGFYRVLRATQLQDGDLVLVWPVTTTIGIESR